jgi:hypothetical protein
MAERYGTSVATFHSCNPVSADLVYRPRGFRHTSHGAQPGILIWHDSAYKHDNGRYSTRNINPTRIEHSRALRSPQT